VRSITSRILDFCPSLYQKESTPSSFARKIQEYSGMEVTMMILICGKLFNFFRRVQSASVKLGHHVHQDQINNFHSLL